MGIILIMQNNKNNIVKVGVAGVVASCIAAGAIYAVEGSQSQFSGDQISQSDYEFMSYVSVQGKSYTTKTEYKMRQANWAKADVAIKAHNADPETTSTAGHNFTSDLTEVELKSMKGFTSDTSHAKHYATDLSGAPPANGIDWVTKGKVTPIQN